MFCIIIVLRNKNTEGDTMDKEKRIPDDKYRIIKNGKEALFELIYESFIDSEEQLFDISDGTSIVTGFDIDWEKGEFICVARNELDENEHLHFDIDISEVLTKINPTTDSLYNGGKHYIELSKSDIDNL